MLQDSFPSQIPAQVEKFSEEMTMASEEAKLEGGRFWLQLMGYTSLAWLSRFAIVVAILIAFHCQGNMLVAWCRQWVMWMISIMSPTRGRVDVPPLLCRFPARCLSSHPCRHALARHLLLPFPGDGYPGFAEMDSKEIRVNLSLCLCFFFVYGRKSC